MINHTDIEAFNENPMIDPSSLMRLWNSGFVRRFHCNSDRRLRDSGDMNGGHAQRVAILYMGLFMGARRTEQEDADVHLMNIMCALLHDAPEVVSGDIPQPGKVRVLELWTGDKAAEVMFWNMIAAPWSGESNWSKKSAHLNLCDLLDAILFTKKEAPDRLTKLGWPRDIELCLEMARDLGVEPTVRFLIETEFDFV